MYQEDIRHNEGSLISQMLPFYAGTRFGRQNIYSRRMFFCSGSGCEKLIPFNQINKHKTRECRRCRDKRIFGGNGEAVKDPWVRENLHLYSHSERKGRQVVHYLRCSTDGCENVRSVKWAKVKGHTTCNPCWGKRQRRDVWGRIANQLRMRTPGAQQMSLDEIMLVCSQSHCGYCLKSLPKRARLAGNERQFESMTAFLDRVNASGLYTSENVLPCCPACNNLKSDKLSAHETLVFALLKRSFRDSAVAAMRAGAYKPALARLTAERLMGGRRALLALLSSLPDHSLNKE